jgi:DNA-directed RNA polymerase specialized sigma24 family protein
MELTREEVEIILGWWEEEKDKTRATFLESLTPGQRELLRRYYRAKRKVATLKKWLKQEKKIRRRKVAVPAWAQYDYGLLRLARAIGLSVDFYEKVDEALRGLHEVERAILKGLYGFEGRRVSLRELSERMALPIGVILALRRRAMWKLAKMLELNKEKDKLS